MASRPEKNLSRLITCRKCAWSYSSQKGSCPMCGEPPAPMGEEELATVLMRLIERKGILIEDNEARNFIRKFKKEYKRFPDEKDLVRAADEFVKVDSMSKQELKAKAIVDKKRQKEGLAKGQVAPAAGVPGRKETELDLGKKIEELRQKRAVEKQQQLEMAKAKMAPSKAATPVEEEELVMPEESATISEPETEAPPQAPPIPAPTPAGKCPKCSESNPPDSMFCLVCGEKMVVEVKSAVIPEAPAAPPAPAAPSTPAASVASKGEVICPECKNSNPPGSSFCLECGAKIEAGAKPAAAKADLICPGCKYVNPPGSRFCLECGNPM